MSRRHVLLHIFPTSGSFVPSFSLWCSLSLGGCDTAVLFRTLHSTIAYFWLFDHSMGFCINFHRGYFLSSPSLFLSPSPSSLFSLHVETRGCCVCVNLTYLFNLWHYLLLCVNNNSLQDAAAPTDPSAINRLKLQRVGRVWDVISSESISSGHFQPSQ